MVQKAAACTVAGLAQALKELFDSTNPIHYIGIRHGEKKHETLLTWEECLHAHDLGDFYRVPADNRSLNYEQYLEQGKKEVTPLEEFNSSNALRLSVKQIKDKLLTTEYIRKELAL